MIAKRVMRNKAGSFKRLGAYITTTPQASISTSAVASLALADTEGEYAAWERTAAYILGEVSATSRVGAVRITNCNASEIGDAITEIAATQAMNTTARGSRTYHLVISFPPDESPTSEQLHDIEDELVKAIGFNQHQRISAVHTDTAHLHIHVAINQVHPETLTVLEPWKDRWRLMRTCERLEIKHGLTRTFHGKVKEKNEEERPLRVVQGAKAMDTLGAGPSLLGWIHREVRPKLLDTIKHAGSWQDLHQTLAGYGLALRRRGAGLVIAELSDSRITVKASSVDRSLGLQTLEKRFGSYVRPDAEVVNKAGKAKRTYGRAKVHRHKDLNQLFEEWEELRDERRKPFDAVEASVKR
jgi:hypothetical protein